MQTIVSDRQAPKLSTNPNSVSGEFKFLMRPTSERDGAVLEEGRRCDVTFFRTMMIGVMPKALLENPGEELWDCDITLRPRSHKMPLTEFEIGGPDKVTLAARLYIRHGTNRSGERTTMVYGVSIHPEGVGVCTTGRDEMWEGEATIVPLRKYDGTEAFSGFRADQMLCNTEFENPEDYLPRIFGEAPHGKPAKQELRPLVR